MNAKQPGPPGALAGLFADRMPATVAKAIEDTDPHQYTVVLSVTGPDGAAMDVQVHGSLPLCTEVVEVALAGLQREVPA